MSNSQILLSYIGRGSKCAIHGICLSHLLTAFTFIKQLDRSASQKSQCEKEVWLISKNAPEQ